MAKELKKASFIRRLAAFVIDMILIAFIAGIIATPFVNTSKIDKLNEKEVETIEKYRNEEITADEYVMNYGDVYYELIKENGISTLISIILSIGYFIVFQLYNKGQTLGKKLLKIKIISDDKELSMNQMIFRCLLSNFILVNIINFAFLIFASKYVYIIATGSIEAINYIVAIVSIIMATTKEGRTIHDRIAHTRVVMAK